MAKVTVVSAFFKGFEVVNDLDIQEAAGVEVNVEMHDGEKRWCFFITPQALTRCGDILRGTNVRFHYECRYMIVVAAKFDEKMIGEVLQAIAVDGGLEECTRHLDDFPIGLGF